MAEQQRDTHCRYRTVDGVEKTVPWPTVTMEWRPIRKAGEPKGENVRYLHDSPPEFYVCDDRVSEITFYEVSDSLAITNCAKDES